MFRAPDFSLLKSNTMADVGTFRPVGITSFETTSFGALHFINAKHARTIPGAHSPTHKTIEAAINLLKPDVIIIEGVATEHGMNPVGTVDFARRQMNSNSVVPESPYAALLANQKSIDFIGGEPSHEHVSRYVISKTGATSEEMMAANVIRQIIQMKRDNTLPADENLLATKLTNIIQGDNALFKHISKAERLSYSQFKQILLEAIGKSPTDVSELDAMPLISPQANLFQRLSHFSGKARDEHILWLIHKTIGTNKNALVVYGDGHLVCQLPVLQNMFAQLGNFSTVVPPTEQLTYENKIGRTVSVDLPENQLQAPTISSRIKTPLARG